MRIDPLSPIELSGTMKGELTVFVAMMEESLPNESLRASLQRTDDDIRGFLGIMKDIFGIE